MTMLHPPIEPRQSGHLAVSGGHRVYFEESGNPRGQPVLFLHGGPGSASKPDHRRYFDPVAYRIVLFDQRGCGRSEPAGAIHDNTTSHLVADIEAIRERLGVRQWTLFGGSWGSSLALAYAQAHPQRVGCLILRGIFLASRDELSWYFLGLRQFIPEAWHALWDGIPVAPADWPGLVRAYDAMLHQPDTTAAIDAARRWNAYETAIMSIGMEAPMAASANDAPGALARARIQVHYLAHDCFLRPGELLDNLPRVSHLPATIVHGRMDFVCPPVTAYELAARWPGAKRVFVARAGHASSHPDLERELVLAADAARGQS